jgi:hypothetical protein
VRAVNLLPEKHRPRKSTGGKGNGGYVVLGVLGALLIGVLVYVLTLNSINSSTTQITEAKAEAVRLGSQADSLGPYGNFAKIKAERVASVMLLAQGRFDYERLVRELASVLPTDVWLISASASTAAPSSSATGGAAAGPAVGGAGTTPAAGAGPVLTLQGCARDQSEVAVTLVRLRELQGATDVTLDHSTRGADTGATAASAPQASGGAGDTGCGNTSGKPNYSFQANVTFPAAQPLTPAGVPNRLGGGA